LDLGLLQNNQQSGFINRQSSGGVRAEKLAIEDFGFWILDLGR